MATLDDSEDSEDESEEEQSYMALMSSSEAPDSILESNSDPNEVFLNLTCYEVESCLTAIFKKFQSLENRHKDLKRTHVVESEAFSELEKENVILKEEFFVLEKYNSASKRKSKELEKEILLEAVMDFEDVIKKYDMNFQKFLA